jgi:predicted N-acyltransferase
VSERVIEVVVLSSLGELPAPSWDRLAAHLPFYAQRAWFEAAPHPGPLRLLVARSGGKDLALLPLFLVKAPGHYFHSPRDIFCGLAERHLLHSLGYPTDLAERVAAAPWFPAAISLSPYGYRGGLLSTLAGPELAPVAAALAAAADELCRREAVRLSLFYGLRPSDDLPLLAALASRGATPLVVGAHCDLEIRWPSLDAYFHSLGSRGRRLRSAHRRAARSTGWQVWREELAGFERRQSEQAVELFAATARRHGDPGPPVGLYQALLGSWPGSRVLLSRQTCGGDLASALLVFVDGETLFPKLWGARVREDYFYLTYSRLVELAIACGARRIAYGGGSHHAKLLRGARLAWLFGAVNVYDPQLAALLTRFLPLYQTGKVQYFSELAARFQIDHSAPELSSQPPFLDLSHPLEKGA